MKKIVVEKDLGEKETFAKWNGKFLDETSYDKVIKVTDEETKERIDSIAKNQNSFVDKKENETAVNGDLVVFDYEATIENKSFEGSQGKNTQIILGKDLFIKGFDKQLIGVKKTKTKKL